MKLNLLNYSKVSVLSMMSIVCFTGCSNKLKMHSNVQSTDSFRGRSDLFSSPSSNHSQDDIHNSRPSSSSHDINANNSHKNNTPVYTKAVNVKNEKVRYVPVPVPGQLMPIPKVGSQNASNELHEKNNNNQKTPLQVVKEANNEAMIHPSSEGYFNSVMTYEYMPGAVYVVYTAPLNITDIMLQPGEQVVSFSAGDTVRWTLTRTRSGAGALDGSGDDIREHLIIRPQKPGLENNMLITTDKRVYHLVLFSTHNKTYMVAVNWNYPEDFSANNQLSDLNGFQNSGPMLNDTLTLDIANLNFNYQFGMVEGDKPSWFPVRVFSSKRQTYIEFNRDFGSSELPMLYVQSDNKTYATMVNWRLIGRFMVVDSVIDRAKLVMGIKKTGITEVMIERKK